MKSKLNDKGIGTCHFLCAQQKTELVEIRGTSVNNSTDVTGKQAPQGCFFAAKEWGPSYLKELSVIRGRALLLIFDTVNCCLNKTESEDSVNGTVLVMNDIYGINNQKIAQVFADFPAPFYAQVKTIGNRNFSFFIGSFVIFLLTVFVFIIVWITLPLQFISKTLKSEKLMFINPFLGKRSEFGELSRLIKKFFKQKKN